jgi:outer membrane immunogenic protein
MRAPLLSLAATLFLATPALAGGPVAVTPEPEPAAPAAPAAYDWSGAYLGIGYGTTSAGFDLGPLTGGPFPAPAESRDLTDGTATSIHFGYLFQRGAIVYGPELAYSSFSDTGFELSPEEEVKRTIDLKARLGYAANRVLVYGVLGYSQITFAEGPSDSFSVNGPAYGLGVDYAASDRLTIGLEYLARRTSGRFDPPGRDYDLNVDTLSLRVGLRF